MWAKLNLIESINYEKVELLREHRAQEDGTLWNLQYSVNVKSGKLKNIINLMSKRLGNCDEFIVEFLLGEDQGNIHAPPCSRIITNLGTEDCIIDFYHEDLGANVYFAMENLVNIYHTDFDLYWSVVVAPNETILIDATLPTRIKSASVLLWREWSTDFNGLKERFTPWIATTAEQKSQEMSQELVNLGLDQNSPATVKKNGKIIYQRMPPITQLDDDQIS